VNVAAFLAKSHGGLRQCRWVEKERGKENEGRSPGKRREGTASRTRLSSSLPQIAVERIPDHADAGDLRQDLTVSDKFAFLPGPLTAEFWGGGRWSPFTPIDDEKHQMLYSADLNIKINE
jgi:hypothetical protein